jgi:hypothetical protein
MVTLYPPEDAEVVPVSVGCDGGVVGTGGAVSTGGGSVAVCAVGGGLDISPALGDPPSSPPW